MLSLMITCLGKNSTERAELANHITSFYAVARSTIRHEIFVRQKQKRMGYLPEQPKKLTQISRVTHRQL
jgi:hypothetical protein